jgi:xanthine dehydrogenase accessory factor
LGDVIQQIRPDTYVVIASHGNYDEAALEHVLQAKPRYVGLVASKKRYQTIAEYLKMQGLSDGELKAIKAPAGLDIQAQGADEIALSIMAEIVQIRRSSKKVYEWATISLAEPAPEKLTAIDPVCGMEITIAKAKASYEYQGQMYYFCCKGCKGEFANNPHDYLQTKLAIDPVCKMEVEIATAHYKSEYEGVTYYFCCAGCKTGFDKNPMAYLETTGRASSSE